MRTRQSKKTGWIIISALLIWASLWGEPVLANFQGRVTLSDGKAVANVAVSNGLHVVRTDSNGAFSLPDFERARFVFLCVPAGFRAKDAFYLPVNSETKTWDFTLLPTPYADGEEVRFAQVSDVETDSLTAWISDFRRVGELQKCAFLVSTGDHCRRDGIVFNAQNVSTDTMGQPVYRTLGNHDLVKDLERGEQFYEQHFGPCWYSLDAGPIHFVVLPMWMGDARPSFSETEVARWLKNDLASLPKGKPVVVFCHAVHNFRTLSEDVNFLFGEGTDTLDLRSWNVKAFIFGHHHNNIVHRDEASGVVFATVSPGNKGGKDHAPGNIQVYTLDANGLKSVDSRETYVNHQLTITSPQDTLLPEIRVQAYDTAAPVVSVRYTLTSESGETLGVGEMKHEFGWTWHASLSEKETATWAQKKRGTLAVEAVFSDGEKRRATRTWNASDTFFLRECWTAQVGGNLHLGPVVLGENGELWIATGNDDAPETNRLVCLTREGKIRRSIPLRNAVRSRITRAGKTLFFSDVAWNVYAVNMQTGKILWTTPLGAKAYILLNAPAVKDGLVFAGQEADLVALDAKTGALVWKNSEWKGGIVTTSPHSLWDEKLIVSSNWDALYAHEPKTGKLLWRASDAQLRYRSSEVVSFRDASHSHDMLLTSANRSLLVIDPRDGKILRSENTGMNLQTASAPVVFQNLILVGTATDGLAAMDVETLACRWKFKPGENLFYAAPYTAPSGSTVEATVTVLKNRYLVFGALDGCLYVLEPTPQEGRLIQKMELGAPILAPVVVEGNRLYVTDFSGNVHALEWTEGPEK